MPRALHLHIVRFFSLMLAIYMLNISFDVPVLESKTNSGNSAEKSFFALFLDIDLAANSPGSEAEDCSKEIETESSTESFDVFHYSHSLNLQHHYISSIHTKHAHHLSIEGRALEITSPPPQH